jgi:hypothetical protein
MTMLPIRLVMQYCCATALRFATWCANGLRTDITQEPLIYRRSILSTAEREPLLALPGKGDLWAAATSAIPTQPSMDSIIRPTNQRLYKSSCATRLVVETLGLSR